ncbi:C-type lectin domain family 4 member K [Trichosurus vulpecula]|uniref:C-type lectin domain family 4 member K n=1 Tax=Trichosurus vulpecula TaxID=9337 RepID=UPI00186AE9B8|nr:C-type lectin domain family 4 member K [Trichosurus vulpecula]
MKENEVGAQVAHFTVDNQDISLWPRDPPPKKESLAVPRTLPSVYVAIILLAVGLAAFLLAMIILYPQLLGRIDDVKTSVHMLQGRAENTSVFLSSEIRRLRNKLEDSHTQVQMLNHSLGSSNAQIQLLGAMLRQDTEQLQVLMGSWEELQNLNAQIPTLKQDLKKTGELTAKVEQLRKDLQTLGTSLSQQRYILEMASQDWKFFGGNFYYFSTTKKSWYSAEQLCTTRDSHLTSVTSAKEQEFLYKVAKGVPYWIGLTKIGSSGNWRWVDGTLYIERENVRFWVKGEPNNVGENEHCVTLEKSSLMSWNDRTCDQEMQFICKKDPKPLETDQFHDGILLQPLSSSQIQHKDDVHPSNIHREFSP